MTMPEQHSTPTPAAAGGEVVYLDVANSPAVQFLDVMYAGCTEHGWLTGVVIDDNGARTFWSPLGDSVALVRQLAPYIGVAGVYFGVATRAERLPAGRRGGADDCVEIPALWVDIDVAGAGHKTAKRLATRMGQAFAALGFGTDARWRPGPTGFPLAPSMIVRTGGGLHAYWLTVEAMAVDEGTALNARLHGHLSRIADQHHGFEFDRTCDAPRILRLPGTQNVKPGLGAGGAPVEVVWPLPGEPIVRYQQSELDDAIEQLPDNPIGPDTSTRRLSQEERSSEYFTGDSPFALWNQNVTIPQMMDSLGMVFVEQWRDGSMAWRRAESENHHNFVMYADDDHLACYTDASILTMHREYHPHSLLIDGFFAGNAEEASRWLISQGYVAEEAKAKTAAWEAFADRIRARQGNIEHAAAVAEALEAGEPPPRARLRGVDAFFAAQLDRPKLDIPLAEVERQHLPRLGLNSLAGHIADIAAMPARRWVIRDLIIEGQHGVLSAGAKTGKTTTVADMAVSIAGAVPFLGFLPVVRSGAVLVLLGEGGVRPFLKRVQAIGRTRGLTDEQIAALPIYATEKIPHVADDMHLIAMAQALADIEEHAGQPPVMVILDPWYLAAGGDAELGNLYSMGALLDRVQQIVAQFDRTALQVVHHHNRNRASSGVDRMSGAGPMEWGRFLIALDADPARERTPKFGEPDREADLAKRLTDVTIVVSTSGGEIPAAQFAYRRRMWTENPAEADDSPDVAVLGYLTEPVPVDARKDADMPPARLSDRERKDIVGKLAKMQEVADGMVQLGATWETGELTSLTKVSSFIGGSKTTASEGFRRLVMLGFIEQTPAGYMLRSSFDSSLIDPEKYAKGATPEMFAPGFDPAKNAQKP